MYPSKFWSQVSNCLTQHDNNEKCGVMHAVHNHARHKRSTLTRQEATGGPYKSKRNPDSNSLRMNTGEHQA